MIDPLASRDIPEIARIDAPTPDVFEQSYRRPGRPIVMRVPIASPLSLDELRAKFGEVAVSALPTVRGHLRGTPAEGTAFGVVRLGDVLDAVTAGHDAGWHISTPVADLPEELARTLGSPLPCSVRASFERSRMWLAPAGTVTPLHWDLPNNFVRPIVGRRRVLLYPPAHGLLLRPNAITSKMANFTRFDPEQPDRRRYPLAGLARPVRVVLAPGEVLFIPTGWWHHIRSLEASLVVNSWWGRGALSLVWRAAQQYKELRGAFRGEWSAARETVRVR